MRDPAPLNIPWGRIALISFAVVIAMYLASAAAFGIDYGWRWFTAEPKGQLEAREQIQSGPMRLSAHNYFYDACASIQALEFRIDGAQETVAKDLSQPGDFEYTRVRTNLEGLKGLRHEAIAKYNAEADDEYVEGQFRDAELPFSIPNSEYPTEPRRTACDYEAD